VSCPSFLLPISLCKCRNSRRLTFYLGHLSIWLLLKPNRPCTCQVSFGPKSFTLPLYSCSVTPLETPHSPTLSPTVKIYATPTLLPPLKRDHPLTNGQAKGTTCRGGGGVSCHWGGDVGGGGVVCWSMGGWCRFVACSVRVSVVCHIGPTMSDVWRRRRLELFSSTCNQYFACINYSC